MLTLFAEGGEGEESFSEDMHCGATHNKPPWFLLHCTTDVQDCNSSVQRNTRCCFLHGTHQSIPG